MSKQQANISLSKVFKNHKSKKKIFYLAKKDKDLIDLFINFSAKLYFSSFSNDLLDSEISIIYSRH